MRDASPHAFTHDGLTLPPARIRFALPMSQTLNPFGSEATISSKGGELRYFRLNRLAELGVGSTPQDLAGVIMIGDRDHDVEGAHDNGIDCIGVTWGFGSVHELTTAGAVALVDSPGEVAAAVAATYRS